MARLETLWPFILSWEGGFANVPGDKGGATKYGVTISTWKAQGYDKDGDGDIDVQDLKLITTDDAMRICRLNFWNRWKADEIKDQSVANLLVDWVWASGAHGIKRPQRILGVKVDGIVGPKTIAAINNWKYGQRDLFNAIMKDRLAFINSIAVGTQAKFKTGWLNRLRSIQYGSLTLNTNPKKTVRF
jgi:lysozyme family protein